MKIRENVTLYICEHCKKEMKTEKGMKNHEVKCDLNPLNQRLCHHCEHLECKDKLVDIERPEPHYDSTTKTKGFKCKELNIELYPYSAEKKNLLNRFPDTFDGIEAMKRRCDNFSPWDKKEGLYDYIKNAEQREFSS